ncbi:ABC transporter permease [Nocardioides carbamazepini]|jgi:ribose transport system permease protein|uniref:ABC transporter permease n=1 Tax=Nocardioides carbamazepini TaxID=2854259 RepID=UPI002149D54B|nr:ABC transporter permease [Nocardioides carbamazepini]MCR1785255.1 ABC transporter permease [Nocardioides carbamazepini]
MDTTTSTVRELGRRLLTAGPATIVIATALLFGLSPLVAPGSLGSAPLLSMLPFAAVLAIAAAGQTLVVQQRGLDLSVPGMLALGAVLCTALPQQHGWPLALAVVAGVLGPAAAGLVTGVLVTRFGVIPLIATLGLNAVLLGVVFAVADGTPAGAAPALNQFALERTLGVPNTVLVAVVIVGVVGLVVGRSTSGRRLTAVGVSPRAAEVIGIRVGRYQLLAYVSAGACYGVAGVLLAGYTKTPPLFLGDSYLLPTVAAVVLGGTALTGGVASVVASGVAALFLTQLGQLLRALGWSDSRQLIAQAAVLLVVVLARVVVPLAVEVWRRRAVDRAVAVPA